MFSLLLDYTDYTIKKSIVLEFLEFPAFCRGLKGCTLAKAQEQGIQAQQLPIAEHIQMGSYSRVLTVTWW